MIPTGPWWRPIRRPDLRRAATLALAAWLAACAAPAVPPPETAPGERISLLPLTFAEVPGWFADEQAEALPAFLASCAKLARRPAEEPVGEGVAAGKVRDWTPLCEEAALLPKGDTPSIRQFFVTRFRPYLASDGKSSDGLFTGYYEAELRGAPNRSPIYAVPIYARPPDLVTVDLGRFRDDYKGQRIAGTVVGGRLMPFLDRREIDGGALAGRGLELLWVDDPVDAFFLHVQGSGRVRMEDGSTVRLGYDGHNGHVYRPIGKTLIDRGEVAREAMSMQAIRRWIADHPREGAELMATNPSFIFFRRLDGEAGPIGAQGAALTPGRSLAVDPRFVPLGLPVWLDTTDPLEATRPLRRLVVAQDTGGAIKGPLRGDLFWGFGDQAARSAGAMKQRGRYFLLLPKMP